MKFYRKLCILIAGGLIAACDEHVAVDNSEVIRGLKTIVINEQESSSLRRYPSVLQPSESTAMSFQIAGQMEENRLTIGQQVSAGEVLASLDTRSLLLEVEAQQAAVTESNASAENAHKDLKRKERLHTQGLTSEAALEEAVTVAKTTRAQAERAQKQLATARENLAKAKLKAPYDGIISAISAHSFSNVSAGATIATIVNPDGFEAHFSVSYDIANRMVVGKPAIIRLADNPNVALKGVVTELASSTNTVSSYPVVITLQESHTDLKAGMAIEVSMEFKVTDGEGYRLPVSAIVIEGAIQIDGDFDPMEPISASVFLYDENSETVKKHMISIAGIRENEGIVIEGLKAGDRVAVAGVSFLREGQQVKLLKDD